MTTIEDLERQLAEAKREHKTCEDRIGAIEQSMREMRPRAEMISALKEIVDLNALGRLFLTEHSWSCNPRAWKTPIFEFVATVRLSDGRRATLTVEEDS